MSSPWRKGDAASPDRRVKRDDAKYRRLSQQSPYRQEAQTSSMWEDFGRLYVQEDRVFREHLDEKDAEQERRHKEALALAAAQHERVRQNAERARERVELEIERERKRREDDEMRALETERRARTDREAAERRRQKEELERQEQEQRTRAAEEQEIHAARTRLEEQQRRDREETEKRRRERDEAEAKRKAAEDTAKVQAQPQHPQPASATAPPASTNGASQSRLPVPGPASHAHPAASLETAPASALTSASQKAPVNPVSESSQRQERETTHQRYLELHKRLKDMRRYVITESKKNPALKSQLGDWRRKITQTIGQLTTEKGGHRKPDVNSTLQAALRFPEPSVDVSSFIISSPTDGSPMPMSGPMVYLLNIIAKTVISQLINEASVSAKIAEPIGVLAISIFAQPVFKVNNAISLIDVLLAKFHVCCPILWGIYGNEKTASGRTRIGWWKEDDSWVGAQRHIERMTGLAAGYASLTLRDFGKSSNVNPYPPRNYWKALSYIVNTPPSEAQPTHFVVLKALVEESIPRFIQFYGQAGLVALRKALVDFPAQAPDGPARNAVMVMPQTIKRDLKVSL
ncbi:hypothetical protein MBLNU459_g1373t2 [Dothideomycetes sp. NU459]